VIKIPWNKIGATPYSGILHQSATLCVIKHKDLMITSNNLLSVAPRTSPPLPTTRTQSGFYNLPTSNLKRNIPFMLMLSDLMGNNHCFTAVCNIFISIHKLIYTNTCENYNFYLWNGGWGNSTPLKWSSRTIWYKISSTSVCLVYNGTNEYSLVYVKC